PAVAEAADAVRTHLVAAGTPEGSAALHEAHTRTAAATLGAMSRGAELTCAWFRDFPKARGSKEPLRLLLARTGTELTGYAVLRRVSKWSDTGQPEGEVTVHELGASDAPSLLALARRLVDLDLTAKVTVHGRGVD